MELLGNILSNLGFILNAILDCYYREDGTCTLPHFQKLAACFYSAIVTSVPLAVYTCPCKSAPSECASSLADVLFSFPLCPSLYPV
jgi:hypothetical protein